LRGGRAANRQGAMRGRRLVAGPGQVERIDLVSAATVAANKAAQAAAAAAQTRARVSLSKVWGGSTTAPTRFFSNHSEAMLVAVGTSVL